MLNNIEASETQRVALRRIDVILDPLRLHELNPERYPHLLQSTAPGQQANYDILFAYPEATLALTADMRLDGVADDDHDFLPALDECWRAEAIEQTDSSAALPFRGGWFLYSGTTGQSFRITRWRWYCG